MKNPFIVAKTLLINEQNQALVLRRSVWLTKPERSHQADLPGGMVDEGESEAEAAAREIHEETGVEVDASQLILSYTKTFFEGPKNRSASKFFYVCKLDHTPDVTLSREHESYDWTLVPDLLDTYQFTAFYDESIRYLIEHKLI